MFFVMSDINFTSYTDQNTPDVAADSIKDAIRKLENDSMKLFEWFSDNKMKANKDKWHLIICNYNKIR